MKWNMFIVMALIVMVILNCGTQKELTNERLDRVRQLKPADVTSYHHPIKMEIGWIPYDEHRLVQTKKNEWKVVKHEDMESSGYMPMILVTYPESKDTIWFDLMLDNKTLGKLLKQSLMTQKPIERPFVEYLEISNCGQCHPKHIDIGLESQ